MFKFNNTHIFTGYLKQKLASVNIPTCKIYTQEFAQYLATHGKEDPRIIESIDNVYYGENDNRIAIRVNYLKNNELYNYFTSYQSKVDLTRKGVWKRSSNVFYDSEKNTPGLTKTLYSPGRFYDVVTHEYLGDYLRFLRDYYNINLMSLYNCFSNNTCSNVYLNFSIGKKQVVFDSQDSKYQIYAFPVKLFSDYTIAIDSHQGIELFCGLYNTHLDNSTKACELINKTYTKVSKTIFKQPFLYNKLNAENWKLENELQISQDGKTRLNNKVISRWDIINREQDLKLFIKVPTSCKSSIVVLEGDFRFYNDSIYQPNITKYKFSDNNTKEELNKAGQWVYKQNHSVINFGNSTDRIKIDTNSGDLALISKLQLLEFNTGESYPFADRLVEYLIGSAITPIDEIPDNIKRAQRVMKQNQHRFKIEGLWENKMQKIIYDYMMNSGPIELENEQLVDKRRGYHPRLGHSSKSTLYDILGYIDKDTEKWYASWIKQNGKAVMQENIQNVDIYDGLYDI